MFACPVAWFLWRFVQEALGPARANRTGTSRRRLFWFMFDVMSCTLWTTRNKMVIEKSFLPCVSDLVFKILAFLHLWYALCRQRGRDRVDSMLGALKEEARRLTMPPS
jgi:hypothetical protein